MSPEQVSIVINKQNVFDLTPQNEYQQKAIAFCQQWLSGLAFVELQTSGSTGEPKSIRVSRAQMTASAHLTGTTFGLKAGDTALVCLNIDYIAGKMMLVRGMELGLTLKLVPPSQVLLDEPYDFLAFVPLQLQMMLNAPQQLKLLNRSKAILIGGAAVDQALKHKLQNIKAPVFATYGMTETVSHVAIQRLNGRAADTFFHTLEGVKIWQDTRGCLCVESAATNHQAVITNDLVEMIDSRSFRLIGRIDNVINSGGVKIQLEKVEQAVAAQLDLMGWHGRFFAYGMPDARLGERLVMVIEDAELAQNPEKQQIFKQSRLGLGRYEIPKEWYFVPKFEETPTRKIDKKATFAGIETTQL